jgi:cell division protein FtsA
MEEENSIISRKYLNDIVEARVEEIFKMIDDDLRSINRSKILPVGVFLSGGGSLLSNITKTAKEVLSLPVSFLEPKNVKIEIDKAARPDFMAALSLAVCGSQSGSGSKSSFIKNNIKNIFSKASGFVKRLMPK